MDSLFLQIEKYMSSLIEQTVTHSNGRLIDLTGVVFRGRTRYDVRDPVPMVALIQAPNLDVRSDDAGEGCRRLVDKTYLIQGWVENDPDNPTDPVHELLAEVKRALSFVLLMDSEHYLMGGLITKLSVSVGLVRPAEAGISDKAYFWLPVTVKVEEDLSDPYS